MSSKEPLESINKAINMCEEQTGLCWAMTAEQMDELLVKVVEVLVEVKKEQQLDRDWFMCLGAAGYDNWEGYSQACNQMVELHGDNW